MISSDQRVGLHKLRSNLISVTDHPSFNSIRTNSELHPLWTDARDLALLWIDRTEPLHETIDNSALQPLILFAERVIGIAEGKERRPSEAIPDALKRVRNEFQSGLPHLAYESLQATGMLEFSEAKLSIWRQDILKDVRDSVGSAKAEFSEAVKQSKADIRSSADEAVKDFELAKEKSSKISVDKAQEQFESAAKSLSQKAAIWVFLSILFFLSLIGTLLWLLLNPPELIRHIILAIQPGSKAVVLPVSIPLLVTASAYFTSIRLAAVGAVGIGMAFSLRMMRSYLHMAEHNQHKLRVTKSIEAFVAAVRTKEQKDLVLSKLVESVTEFGDSGILGKQGETSGFPSVLFEAVTKNVGKTEQ